MFITEILMFITRILMFITGILMFITEILMFITEVMFITKNTHVDHENYSCGSPKYCGILVCRTYLNRGGKTNFQDYCDTDSKVLIVAKRV
jgi:hypothetical protein